MHKCQSHGQSVLCHAQLTGKLPLPPNGYPTHSASIQCQMLRDATEVAILMVYAVNVCRNGVLWKR